MSSRLYFGSACCVRTRPTALKGFAKDPQGQQPAQHPLHTPFSIPQPQRPTRTVSHTHTPPAPG